MTTPAALETPTAGRLELMIAELGPASPDMECIVASAPGTWAVRFENSTILHLAWREEPARLELMTLVAPLADGLDAMRALLMFNFLSVDTGGVRMGLSALDRSVYMIRDIPDADLSVHAVQGACRGLADLAAKWAAILAALEAQADAAPAAAQLA